MVKSTAWILIGAGALLALLVANELELSNRRKKAAVSVMEFTQCVRTADHPDPGNHFVDHERNCAGQHWRIPQNYYRRMYPAYGLYQEAVVIRIPIWVFKPVTAEEKKLLSKDVTIMPMVSDPKKLMNHFIGVNEMRVAARSSPWPGMRVLETVAGNEDRGVSHSVVFAMENPTYVASCFYDGKPGVEFVSRHACKVVSELNDRVYLEHYIQSDRLGELESYNRRLVDHLSEFMDK